MAIQIRRGTNTEWESNNSNIVVGEPAIATDAERFFVGTASGDYAEFANLDIIAPAYDTSTSYVVGDVINRQGKLYSCNTPCSGAFNVSYWDEKSLAEILKDLENEIDYAQYEIGYASGKLITVGNGASEIPVKDLTLDIEAVQDLHGHDHPWVGGAGKNKFNYDDVTSLSGLSNNNGVFTNTDTDTRTYFSPSVQLLNGSTIITTAQMSGAIGRNSTTVTIADTITALRIKHNGASRDLRVDYPFTQTGTFTISMTVTDNNPSVVGGLSFKDVQIESGSTATAYEPYTNICPISGWDEVNVNVCGINVWDEEWEVGNINASGAPITTSNSIRSKNFNKILPNTTYYATCGKTDGGSQNVYYLAVFFYDADKNFIVRRYINNATFTTPENACYFKLATNTSTVVYGNTYNNDISINYPSTDHDYHAYNGQTYTIDLDGTRYGGTLDVTTGVLTITHKYVNYDENSFWSQNGSTVVSTNVPGDCRVSQTPLASHAQGYSPRSSVDIPANGCAFNANFLYFNFKFPSDMSVDDWKAILAVNNLQIVYELATPQVVQLTSTQVRTVLGTNNLWNSMNSNNELAYRISNALN